MKGPTKRQIQEGYTAAFLVLLFSKSYKGRHERKEITEGIVRSTERFLPNMKNLSLRGRLDDTLKTVTYREREVLRLLHGIDGFTSSYRELADIFKTTESRIREAEAKALNTLRHPERLLRLAGFLGSNFRKGAATKARLKPVDPLKELIDRSWLGRRSCRILDHFRIHTLEELATHSELEIISSVKSVGFTTIRELRQLLFAVGLDLKK